MCRTIALKNIFQAEVSRLKAHKSKSVMSDLRVLGSAMKAFVTDHSGPTFMHLSPPCMGFFSEVRSKSEALVFLNLSLISEF